jgi:NADH-quinone oxidoreductase subunit G
LAKRQNASGLVRLSTLPMYRTDAVLRRATALQAHPLNRAAAVRVNADEAKRLGVAGGEQVRVAESTLPLVIDQSVPDGSVWIEAGHDLTATLPPYGAAITLSKA